MNGTKPKVVVIVGPTASGKTALALTLAKKFSGEVISADSRQIYRRLDIGTEKITPEEMDSIPHHLIDVCDVETVYNASDFKDAGTQAITEICSHGNLPIIAGGTFFYIDTLLGKIVAPEVPPNPELRAHLEELSTEMLFAQLERTDPERSFTIDRDNKRRLIRALEIGQALGSVPKQHILLEDLPYDVLTIGIQTNKVELRARIRARAEQALTRGLIEETQELLDSGVTHERLSEIGHEYRIVLAYLAGSLDDQALIQKLEEKNWQYAKTQSTWLKRDDSIQWFEHDDIENITKAVATFIE
ncbi:MAG: tRNA dimethylallyltransferase [Acidimicrobiales bacterium]|jgi:tRNA dimethylallyltransferase